MTFYQILWTFFLLQLRRLVLRGRFRRLQNREICKPRFFFWGRFAPYTDLASRRPFC